MKTNVNGKKETGKTLLGAFLAITACALLFNAFSESVIAAELKETQRIPTSYNMLSAAAAEKQTPEGYEKANYKVVADPLEYYQDKKPTAKDLTMEQAAELGAQAVWEIWGVDLEGATIYMGYDPGTDTFPRATWSGDIRFGQRVKPDGNPGHHGYYFSIDAVTGTRFTLSQSRTLSTDVPLELDNALAKDPQAYTRLAKEWAEKHHFVNGKVLSCKYNSQGYESNDPTITIYVTGTNGQTAALTFSRYDKTFTGLIYPESLKITETIIEKEIAELEKRTAQEPQKNAGNSPSLIALP